MVYKRVLFIQLVVEEVAKIDSAKLLLLLDKVDVIKVAERRLIWKHAIEDELDARMDADLRDEVQPKW